MSSSTTIKSTALLITSTAAIDNRRSSGWTDRRDSPVCDQVQRSIDACSAMECKITITADAESYWRSSPHYLPPPHRMLPSFPQAAFACDYPTAPASPPLFAALRDPSKTVSKN